MKFFGFRKNIFSVRKYFFEKKIDKKKIMFFDDFFLSSKSYQVPCSHKFAASNSIYKNMKTQQSKKNDQKLEIYIGIRYPHKIRSRYMRYVTRTISAGGWTIGLKYFGFPVIRLKYNGSPTPPPPHGGGMG